MKRRMSCWMLSRLYDFHGHGYWIWDGVETHMIPHGMDWHTERDGYLSVFVMLYDYYDCAQALVRNSVACKR
jgi:hypothetical protein